MASDFGLTFGAIGDWGACLDHAASLIYDGGSYDCDGDPTGHGCKDYWAQQNVGYLM